jgi:hypothetical protein
MRMRTDDGLSGNNVIENIRSGGRVRIAKYSIRKTGGTNKMMRASIQRLGFQRVTAQKTQLDLRFCPWLLLFKNF